MERNSPLSTSLASSESLSTSLRSSELRNLQQLVENPITEIATTATTSSSITAGINIIEGQRLPPQTLDLASSANTATNVFNLITEPKELSSPDVTTSLPATIMMKSIVSSSSSNTGGSSSNPTTIMTHMHPHLHLQPSSSSKTQPQQQQHSTSEQQQRR